MAENRGVNKGHFIRMNILKKELKDTEEKLEHLGQLAEEDHNKLLKTISELREEAALANDEINRLMDCLLDIIQTYNRWADIGISIEACAAKMVAQARDGIWQCDRRDDILT